MNWTLQYGIPCNSIGSALRFSGGETITYGRNHMIAGFNISCGRLSYVVMQGNINYGEWVLYGFSGFQLVHSMLLEKCDNLPLCLDHDGCALCLSFGVYFFWICAGRRPWRRPLDHEV